MTGYTAVAIYSLDGVFEGYAIKSYGADKFQSTNIWREGEEDSLNTRIAELNSNVDIRQHWPHPQDPKVQELLADPNFAPIEMADHQVIDEDHSHLVYIPEPEVDERGQPTGRTIPSQELDMVASVVNYKTIQAPKRPTDQMWRIKRACEAVARQRAGLL